MPDVEQRVATKSVSVSSQCHLDTCRKDIMELFVTPDAIALIKKRGGVAAIDFVPPIG